MLVSSLPACPALDEAESLLAGIWFPDAARPLGCNRYFDHRACWSWTCSTCCLRLAQGWSWLVHAGIAQARRDGLYVRQFELTDADGSLTLGNVPARWKNLYGRLRRRAILGEYVVVSPQAESGRLHLHGVYLGGRATKKGELAPLAEASGFGHSWIRAGGSARGVAEYVVEKHLHDVSAWAPLHQPRQRLSPVLHSQQWPGGTISALRRRLVHEFGYRFPPGNLIHRADFSRELFRAPKAARRAA